MLINALTHVNLLTCAKRLSQFCESLRFGDLRTLWLGIILAQNQIVQSAAGGHTDESLLDCLVAFSGLVVVLQSSSRKLGGQSEQLYGAAKGRAGKELLPPHHRLCEDVPPGSVVPR